MSQAQSPITGIFDETEVLLDFGPFAGKSVAELAKSEPDQYKLLLKDKEKGLISIRRLKDRSFRLYYNHHTRDH